MKHKLYSAAAFAYGALVGWALTADHFENKAKIQAENDQLRIEKLRELIHAQNRAMEEVGSANHDLMEKVLRYQALHDELVLSDQVPSSDIPEEKVENSPEESSGEKSEDSNLEDDFETPLEMETEEETRARLQRTIDSFRGYSPDEDNTAAFLEINQREIRSAVRETPPFVISKGTYAWDEEGEHYEKVTLTFYPRHRVLLDEDEEVLDAAQVVGWRNLNQFGSESEDPNTVFVRNHRLRTDFEVVQDGESDLPLHVKYGMGKAEFNANRAAGKLRLRPEDDNG